MSPFTKSLRGGRAQNLRRDCTPFQAFRDPARCLRLHRACRQGIFQRIFREIFEQIRYYVKSPSLLTAAGLMIAQASDGKNPSTRIMKKKPEKPKVSLAGPTLAIFATPSKGLPDESVETPAASKTAETPGTFWELLHDADLRVVTDPWPPMQGAGRLKVEVTAADSGRKFEGTVAYRVAKTERNSVAWQPLSKVRRDKYETVFFEAPILLGKGSAYIQFRVRGAGEAAYKKEFIDLTDWKVEVA